ncbi:hypothetical protein, partial [uncultured Chitinibacter sp.]|uniref:hypothetical protein n=1 Tax=uncultured Chitinibacter sp. TaxID=1214081 RepID=UPI002599AC73
SVDRKTRYFTRVFVSPSDECGDKDCVNAHKLEQLLLRFLGLAKLNENLREDVRLPLGLAAQIQLPAATIVSHVAH